MRYVSIAFAATSLLAGQAYGQAFGVQPGDPVSKYDGKPTGNKNQYEIFVPLPNSEFARYIAIGTPQTGICAVLGIGVPYLEDNYGDRVLAAFRTLKVALRNKYGQSKDYDFILETSTLREPDQFGWSLYKNERALSSFWNRSSRARNLESVSSIGLAAKAVGPGETYISLRYEFRNFTACGDASDQNDNAGL